MSRIVRNTELAIRLKELYEYRCQVCGEQRRRTAGDAYAEAHHLRPLGGDRPGPDVEENILVLCPNHHADFDYGMITVDPQTLEVTHGYDSEVDGNSLHVEAAHNLSDQFLRYHDESISEL